MVLRNSNDGFTVKVKVTVSTTGDAVIDVVFASACILDEQFTDFDSNAWYHDGVHCADKNSLMDGLTDTIFSPNVNVTSEQLLSILMRYVDYKGC